MSSITAIVSAYFAEKYLAGRLDNLLEQKPKPEIIIVCQTDSIEYTIAKGYPVKVIETPDIPTIYSAWNLAIKQSSGTYLFNANCDDRLLPGALKTLAIALDEHPKYAVAYGNQDIISEIDGEVTGKFEWAEGGLEQLLNGCFLGPMPMWRRSLHDKYGYFDADLQVAGDYEFWLRLAAAGEQFFHVRETVGIYLSNQQGAEKRQQVRTVWETARARARYRKGAKLWQY